MLNSINEIRSFFIDSLILGRASGIPAGSLVVPLDIPDGPRWLQMAPEGSRWFQTVRDKDTHAFEFNHNLSSSNVMQ